MAALLALLSALAYGVSDFAAGVASRGSSAATVTGVARVLGLLTAVIAVVIDPGVGRGHRHWPGGRSAGSAARSKR